MTTIDELAGRELDMAVAEAIGIDLSPHIFPRRTFKFTNLGDYPVDVSLSPMPIVNPFHTDENGNLIFTPCVPRYSNSTFDFDDVKRELEHKGWGWAARYVPSKRLFRFEVNILPTSKGVNNIFKARAETEALAGCRAFLKAIKATEEDCNCVDIDIPGQNHSCPICEKTAREAHNDEIPF